MTGEGLYFCLGRELEGRRQYHAALECYLKERSTASQAAAAGVLIELSRVEEASDFLHRALRQQPRHAEFHRRLAQCWIRLGDARRAVRHFRRALELEPSDSDARSGLLVAMHYGPDFDPAALYSEHLEWGRRQSAPVGDAVQSSPRVGYISPVFRGAHPVSYFIAPVIQAHRERPTCYAGQDQPADLTHARWRNIAGWSDERLFDQIRRDGIGILVDLAGHFSGNRLRVFARKPAPVQVTWLGYPNTTGLKTIDYRLTDSIADPPGATEHLHAEQLVRLPGCFLCYQPPANAPAVKAAPVRRSARPFTYGCFNKLVKITPATVALWASILRATPESRLLLHHGGSAYAESNPETRAGLWRRFEKCGVAPERIQVVPFLRDPRDHLKLYREVDVSLDTFPYNGTTTTCESLWMGVPVITLAGEVHVSRVGVSLLQAAGLPEWIAATPEEYRRLAIGSAADRDGLARLRRTLRKQVAGSMLTDSQGFTRRLEKTYQDLWAAGSAKT
jgi:protein O-GlcNAc transferase